MSASVSPFPSGGAAPAAPVQRVILVTGMSGAGKTSALKILEDMGYEAIDNVPLSLLGSLVAAPRVGGKKRERPPLAIGVDIRTRDFSVDSIIEELATLAAETAVRVSVLYLDCEDDALGRRYVETRRRHPLAVDRPVADGIDLERRLLSPLRDRADVTLDTTGITLGDLKRTLQGQFGLQAHPVLSIQVTSFSFRRGLPREADLVFDVRFLTNPYYQPDLRLLTGLDAAVGEYIEGDKDFETFFDGLTGLLQPLLPRYVAEGKSYLTIAIGCTGGRHRSVFVAGRLAAWLEKQGDGDLAGQGRRVHLRHRDLPDSGS
jgi:UPF0042 nucleotide-binding protein